MPSVANGVIPGKSHKDHLLADGQQRAIAAHAERVRIEVQAQFADELNTAGWFRRLMIGRRIRRELKRRLNDVAPTEALY